MKPEGKVVVVDDEAHIRKFVALLIKSLGNFSAVFQAGNGGDALHIYQREKPALVLLDVNMPRVDGLETLRNLKAFDPACTVVMLTSLVNRQTVEECLRLGAVGYLRKDNPPDDMTLQLKKSSPTLSAPNPRTPLGRRNNPSAQLPPVMATSDTSSPLDPELDPLAPFVEVRYSLSALLQEVKRDRASSAFAMEKLDQPSITALFELQQQRSRRDPNSVH